jgi:hypothetical protein
MPATVVAPRNTILFVYQYFDLLFKEIPDEVTVGVMTVIWSCLK